MSIELNNKRHGIDVKFTVYDNYLNPTVNLIIKIIEWY
jgi:hypothetical protein